MNILAAISFALLLQAKADEVRGTVSAGNASMQVLDATAVWDAEKGEMKVVLLPTKLQLKFLPEIQKGDWWRATADAPSPDPKKWADWCPAAIVTIAFKRKDATKGPAGIESVQLGADGLTRKGFVETSLNQTDSAPKEFSKLVFKPDGNGGGTLTAAFSRKGENKDSLIWNVSLTCPVLPSTAPK
jgi:hypothetical protein